MTHWLRVGTLTLTFLGLTGSTNLLGQISPLQDSGLVDGKREMVCPHASARALASFVSHERSQVTSASAHLYGDKLESTWAYLDISSASVPTLMPDGNMLDYRHPNNVDLVSYWMPNGSVKKSFWARRFDQGSILTSGSKMISEGVDDLSAISATVKTKRFALVQGELTTPEHLKDLVWTNTIFVDSHNAPQSKNLENFRQINEQLLNSLNPPELRELPHKGVVLTTTVKLDSGEQILTVFVPDQSASVGHLVGYLHLLSSDSTENDAVVNAWFSSMKVGTRVYICGHDVNIDFTRLAESHGVVVIRRGPNVVRDIMQTDRAINAISTRGLRPESTSILNGIPSTRASLESMGKPVGGLDQWNAFHTKIEQEISGHYSRRIETKKQLYEELSGGKADVLFLLAHFDGKALYFGEEKASFDEIAALKGRKLGGRPRVAVLFACDSGNLSNEQRSFFRKQVKSIGELFVSKGFFDEVIAPQHEIQSGETMIVLKDYLKNTRVTQKGWVTLAAIGRMERSNEIFQ